MSNLFETLVKIVVPQSKSIRHCYTWTCTISIMEMSSLRNSKAKPLFQFSQWKMDDIWLKFIHLWWYRLWPATGYNRAGPQAAAPARRGRLLRATARGHWKRHLSFNEISWHLTFHEILYFIWYFIWWTDEELMKNSWRTHEKLMKNLWKTN